MTKRASSCSTTRRAHRCRDQAGDLPAAARPRDAGAAILLYSTDYDELIGCCDRVAILYQGRIQRELAGSRSPSTTSSRARSTWRRTPPPRGSRHEGAAPLGGARAGMLGAIALFIAMFGSISATIRPGSRQRRDDGGEQGVLLALVPWRRPCRC